MKSAIITMVGPNSNSPWALQLITRILDEATRCFGEHTNCSVSECFPWVKNVFCGSELLGGIWAAIQTELLTYRRIAEGYSWVSSRCSLDRLLTGIKDGVGAARLPLHEEFMMQEISVCGWFVNANNPLCALAEEESSEYMMDTMEDWKSTTFITHINDL